VSVSFVTDTLSEWPYRNGRSILQTLSKSLNSYKEHILGAFFSGEVFSQTCACISGTSLQFLTVHIKFNSCFDEICSFPTPSLDEYATSLLRRIHYNSSILKATTSMLGWHHCVLISIFSWTYNVVNSEGQVHATKILIYHQRFCTLIGGGCYIIGVAISLGHGFWEGPHFHVYWSRIFLQQDQCD